MAVLGGWVKSSAYGQVGRVYAKYHNFKETNEDEYWFMAQKIPFAKADRNRPWYSILTKDGGSILAPESYLTNVEPQGFLNNPWESYYFGEEK